jgi:ATP-dependent Clp protease protease subunit
MQERLSVALPTAIITDALRERLFRARTLIISGEINNALASHVIAQLLALAADSVDPVTVLNSQGGHVESGDAVHDMVCFTRFGRRSCG